MDDLPEKLRAMALRARNIDPRSFSQMFVSEVWRNGEDAAKEIERLRKQRDDFSDLLAKADARCPD